jgi:homoserine kinase
MIRVRIPATAANLGPGLDCLGLALGLYSEVHLEESSRLAVQVQGMGAGEISRGEDNLVVRSIRRVLVAGGYPREAFGCRIINGFPLARGLGSSAAAIVGGAVAANRLLNDALAPTELLGHVWPLEGHLDNLAAALLGGFTIAGQKERGIFAERFDPPPLHAALAIPERQLSTRKARRVLPRRVALADAIANIQHTALWFHVLCSGDYDALWDATTDLLHQPHRQTLIPGMEEALKTARAEGAFGAFVSGAGPTLLALAKPEAADRVAARMAEVLTRHGTKAEALAVPLSPTGAEVV